MAEDLAQELEACLIHVVRRVGIGEVAVIVVGPSSGLEPGYRELLVPRIVAATVSASVSQEKGHILMHWA